MSIDKNKAKESLFGNIKRQGAKPARGRESVLEDDRGEQSSKAPQYIDSERAKEKELFRTTIFLSEEKKDGLDSAAKLVMRQRDRRGSRNKERITSNTFIRAGVSAMLSALDGMDLRNVYLERDLETRIAQGLLLEGREIDFVQQIVDQINDNRAARDMGSHPVRVPDLIKMLITVCMDQLREIDLDDVLSPSELQTKMEKGLSEGKEMPAAPKKRKRS